MCIMLLTQWLCPPLNLAHSFPHLIMFVLSAQDHSRCVGNSSDQEGHPCQWIEAGLLREETDDKDIDRYAI